MSKKKENQFLCSSMMLPEHREKLAARHKSTGGEKRAPFPGEQTREELAHNLTQSLLHKLPVEIWVRAGGEILPMSGVIVGSRSREGTIKLRLEKTGTTIKLDSIVGCRLAPGEAPRE